MAISPLYYNFSINVLHLYSLFPIEFDSPGLLKQLSILVIYVTKNIYETKNFIVYMLYIYIV